jgi:CRP-like cAMP-binding protein
MAENLLIKTLPQSEKDRLLPFAQEVEFSLGQVLIAPDEPINHIYFPCESIVSIVQVMEDGSSVESALIGMEGLVGVPVWLGKDRSPMRAIVQVEGPALRISTKVFCAEVVKQSTPLNDLIAAYINGYLVLSSQTAACNRLHSLEQRMCRWLLTLHDRLPSRETFGLRQEFLAQMLGVHRPSVSIVAGELQKAGLINYSRGKVKILNPEGLRAGACECLEVVRDQFPLLEHARNIPQTDSCNEDMPGK